MNMDDLPEREPPRFWIAFGVLCAAFTLAFFMLVYSSVRAEAQDRSICAPAKDLFPQYSAVLKEKIVWEGNVKLEQGVLEFVLFQGETGKWSLFVVQDGIACLRAQGQNGTPNELGKGV